jgi:hypothetical protein
MAAVAEVIVAAVVVDSVDKRRLILVNSFKKSALSYGKADFKWL